MNKIILVSMVLLLGIATISLAIQVVVGFEYLFFPKVFIPVAILEITGLLILFILYILDSPQS